jgi:alpha-tubulin suppressor-like RCC1 family protein
MSGKVAVFSWGNNDKGQIGVGQHVRMNRPGVVGYLNEYSNSKALDICCGKYFSMVLMKRNDCEEFYKEPKVNYRVIEVCCEFA